MEKLRKPSQRLYEFIYYWNLMAKEGKVSDFSPTELKCIEIYDNWLSSNNITKEIMNK